MKMEFKKLQRLYSRLPRINCKKKCHESCGPIVMSEVEMDLISERLGYNPFGDAQIQEINKKAKEGKTKNECLTCPLLDNSKMCTIYDIRPMICRIFGLVKKLRCPHGCVPAKWLNDRQAKHFLDLADSIKSKDEYLS